MMRKDVARPCRVPVSLAVVCAIVVCAQALDTTSSVPPGTGWTSSDGGNMCRSNDDSEYAWFNAGDASSGFYVDTTYAWQDVEDNSGANHDGGAVFGIHNEGSSHATGTSSPNDDFNYFENSGSNRLGVALNRGDQSPSISVRHDNDGDVLVALDSSPSIGSTRVRLAYIPNRPGNNWLVRINGDNATSFNPGKGANMGSTVYMGWACTYPDPSTAANPPDEDINTFVLSEPACVTGASDFCGDCNKCDPTDDNAGADGCVADSSQNGQSCVHSDACWSGTTCNAGTCEGGSHNPCPLDCEECDGAGGCSGVTGPVCSDGKSCTSDDTCVGGVCIGTCDECWDCSGACTPATNDPCDDGDDCTQTDLCNSSGVCVGSNPVICADFCQECQHPGTSCDPTNEDVACDDGNGCTEGETCSSGTCNGGTTKSCTNPQCNGCVGSDPTSDCEPINDANPCDDNNACTENEVCNNGACTDGDTVVCNGCEFPCHSTNGCVTEFDRECNVDGQACTTYGRCRTNGVSGRGECREDLGPVDCTSIEPTFDTECFTCDDAQSTAEEGCDNAIINSSDETCVPSACYASATTEEARNAYCDDNDPCTTDKCSIFPSLNCVHEEISEEDNPDCAPADYGLLIGVSVGALAVLGAAAFMYTRRDNIADYLAARSEANKAAAEEKKALAASSGSGGGGAAAAAAAASSKKKKPAARSAPPPRKKAPLTNVGKQGPSAAAAAAALSSGKNVKDLEPWLIESDMKLLHAVLTVMPKASVAKMAANIVAIFEANGKGETLGKWLVTYVIDKRKFTGDFSKDVAYELMCALFRPWMTSWVSNVVAPAVSGLEDTQYQQKKLKSLVEAVLGAVMSSQDVFSKPMRNVLLHVAKKSPKDTRFNAFGCIILDIVCSWALMNPARSGLDSEASTKNQRTALRDTGLVLRQLATGKVILKESEAGHLKMFNKWITEQKAPWRSFVSNLINKGKTTNFKGTSLNADQRHQTMLKIQEEMKEHVDSLNQHLMGSGAPELGELINKTLGDAWASIDSLTPSTPSASAPRKSNRSAGRTASTGRPKRASSPSKGPRSSSPSKKPSGGGSSGAPRRSASRGRTSSTNGPAGGSSNKRGRSKSTGKVGFK